MNKMEFLFTIAAGVIMMLYTFIWLDLSLAVALVAGLLGAMLFAAIVAACSNLGEWLERH